MTGNNLILHKALHYIVLLVQKKLAIDCDVCDTDVVLFHNIFDVSVICNLYFNVVMLNCIV